MNSLEMYKKLSYEDKRNITKYGIYNSIYEIAMINDIKIPDDVVINIQELSYNLWLEDEYYNLSENKIADFITECYAKDNSFLEKINDIEYSELLQAVEENNYEFNNKELNIER